MQLIKVEVLIYLFTVFIFSFKALFACSKSRTCLKLAIPVSCFTIFRSNFGVLFCLLIKKLILGSKIIWQSMRKFPCAVWSVRAFPNTWTEKNFFFLQISWNFNIYKQVCKLSDKLFWEERYELFLCPNDMHTLWLLITLLIVICQTA